MAGQQLQRALARALRSGKCGLLSTGARACLLEHGRLLAHCTGAISAARAAQAISSQLQQCGSAGLAQCAPRGVSGSDGGATHHVHTSAAQCATIQEHATVSASPHHQHAGEGSSSGGGGSSSRGSSTSDGNSTSGGSSTSSSVSDGASGASASAPGRAFASLDKREAAKFAALADHWWSPGGPFAPLLALNPARCGFIRQAVSATRGMPDQGAEPLAGLRVLDVGCGGGILSEALARLGAQVHGVDVSDENVLAASAHAAADPLVASRVRYERTSAEALAAGSARYDVVVASEVVEHVRAPAAFVATLTSLIAPGGQVVMSTLNRTPRAYALAVAAAEYVMRIVPPGTHHWTKFLTPQELAMMGADAGLRMELAAGMALNPLTGRWSLSDDLSMNYICLFQQQQQHQQQ